MLVGVIYIYNKSKLLIMNKGGPIWKIDKKAYGAPH